jgi:hypothetical protein
MPLPTEQVGDQFCCGEQTHRVGGDHSRIAYALFDKVIDGARMRGLGSHQCPTFGNSGKRVVGSIEDAGEACAEDKECHAYKQSDFGFSH